MGPLFQKASSCCNERQHLSVLLQRLLPPKNPPQGEGLEKTIRELQRQGTGHFNCWKDNECRWGAGGGEHYREPGRLSKEETPKPRSDLHDIWPVPVGGERKLPECGHRGRAGLTRDPDPKGVVRKQRKDQKSRRASLT